MTITPKPKMPIDNSEISVVVQGLIDDDKNLDILNIR